MSRDRSATVVRPPSCHRVLDALTPDDHRALLALGATHRHRRGTYLMLESERDDDVLLIHEGRVKVVRTTSDGRQSLLAVREAGDLVGEVNALAGASEPRSASVIALDDVNVQSIGAAEFLAFAASRPAVSMSLMRQLAVRLRESTSRQAEAAGYDARRRVARVLVEQGDRSGRPVPEGLLVGAGLSQLELAGLAAASPTSVTRALAVLRSRGLITTARRAIVIRDLEGLRRFGR